MPLYVPVAFFLAVFVETLLIGSLVLWFCCRALRIQNVSARRALGVNLAATALGFVGQLLLLLIFIWTGKIAPADDVAAALFELALSLGCIATLAATQIVTISWLLPATKLKAFVAWIVTNGAAMGLNLRARRQ